MKKTLLLGAMLCLNVLAFGQKVDSSTDSFFKDYVSRIWTSEDGIPGNTITDIFQDKNGYILFGNYGGLTRFDGVKFVTLNKLYDEKYEFFTARSIMQDSAENLWVGSNDEGIICLKKDGDVVSFTMENGLSNNSVRAIQEDKNGNIWVGTASGISCISSDFQIITLKGFEKIPQENRFIVSQLYCDTAGRMWIVTRGEKGLFKYEDGKFSVYEGIKCIKNPIVTAMTQDANDDYWFGVAPYYAVKVSGEKETLHDIGSGVQKGTIVSSIFQDSKKNIWFGLDNGITIYHDGTYSYYDKTNGLADESVVKIIEDHEGNIWIATDRSGIQKLSFGKFQTTNTPTTINAIAQDTFRDVIWMAGDNGLYCYKDRVRIENKITDYCKNIRIRHVGLTKDGALLVSCYEKYGQLKFNLDGTIQNWTKKDGIAGDRIRVALEISNGDIYIGTTTGLSIIKKDTGKIKNITKSNLLENDYIMCIYEDEEKNIWLGTDGGGVSILKDEQIVKTITKENKLAGNVVFKILGLREGEIWICTGTGVSRVKGDDIFTFNATNGFGSDGIFQLISDFSGRVWGLSNRGIFYVKSDDLDKVMEGKKSVVNTKYYNRQDGITSGGVTSTSLSMKDNIGRIWFTLIDGFTIFDPVRNATKTHAPDIKIEEVIVDSEKYDVSKGKIILPPNTKRVVINYTGISFVSSEQILFKTKLEGFEKDYTEWTNMRSSTFTNLKPGEYTFYVMAESGDEVEALEPAVLTIVKTPYLWQRTWFKLLMIVVIAGIICLVIYVKIKRLQKEKEMIEKFSIEVIQALVSTIDAKDKYTEGHSKRVANYSVMLAKALGLKPEECKEVYFSALLHDIGKIGIPDEIINKKGHLTEDEYEKVKQHPVIGSKILKSISIMNNISVGARGHHERFDGSGYPDKKAGDEIPLTARIVGVADAYDAMTSNRSYRTIMPQKKVREEIEKNKGLQFDPVVADKMIEIIDKDDEYDLHEKTIR